MLEAALSALVLLFAYLIGNFIEGRHYQALRHREKLYHDITMVTVRTVPESEVEHVQLVCGSTVVAMDVFKRFVASIKGAFGGRLSSLEPLMDRARREAVLRMKEQARAHGCETILNVRIMTASLITPDAPAGGVEVLAYGTAIKRAG